MTGGLIVSCDWRNRKQSVSHWLKEERQAPRFANHLVAIKPPKPSEIHTYTNTYVCLYTHTAQTHAHTFTILMRDQ